MKHLRVAMAICFFSWQTIPVSPVITSHCQSLPALQDIKPPKDMHSVTEET